MVTLDLKKCQFKKCKRSVFMGRRLCSRHMERREEYRVERRVEHMDINLHMNINHIPVIITIMI